ncbi:phosphoenolpyruvate carboxylase [Helicobacter ailurogastricus]|uniref:phosphoenolpyruvate carboxylase n=1 Tax=Helicobacter ailurogastricus TaxID=1578720 RepID=UPI0022C32FC8|nr:phosphoenolpyruvate carboxylase [Helicobacter ailurogastricus]GLH59493.1 phosphoenolpyruvate carboxylase [Helicobacter ailurogastricus]
MQQNIQVELDFLQALLLEILQEFSPKSTGYFVALKALFHNKATPKSLAKELQATIASDQILEVIKAFSLYHILANLVEERCKNKQPPTIGLAKAHHDLSQAGFSPKDLSDKLKHLSFYPVFTAHPTQSMRRTFLEAIQEMYSDLAAIFDHPCNPLAMKKAKERLGYRLRLLYKSHLVRQEKLEVLFELDNLLYILENSFLPSCLDLCQQIQTEFQEPITHAPLRLGSWIGGDRDGNPMVTNDLLRQVVCIQHKFIIDLYLKELDKLRRELSISVDFCPISEGLQADLKASYHKLDPTSARLHPKEPFRAKLLLMQTKLRNRLIALNSPTPIGFSYQNASELVADIDLLLENLDPSLQSSMLRFKHLVLLAGFHLLSLDFREHRAVFVNALSEVFSLLSLAQDFYALPEAQKLEALNHALELEPVSFWSLLDQVSLGCKRLLEGFLTMLWAQSKIAKQAFSSVIVSMTTQASDLLAVLWLVKQVGLEKDLYITPLFETIEDLNHAPTILKALHGNPHYKAYLQGMQNTQEIMVGYSDSSKDGGIFASNYNLHTAIGQLVALGQELGIEFILFHVRGGSVSRGGGSLEDALLNAPLFSAQSTLKLTEQGEMISTRYLNNTSALNNLSSIMGALLKKSLYDEKGVSKNPINPSTQALMQHLSAISYQTYRQLYTMQGFLEYFKQATPIAFIQELNLGSRPAKRRESTQLEDLRAIPWVFAWTQNRSILPAWYGVGSALKSVDLKDLQACYNEGGFFKVVVDNIAQVLLKVDLDIAKQYHAFASNVPNAKNIWTHIESEFHTSLERILQIRQENALLEKEDLVREGILFRTPYTNALNCLQIELIKVFKHNPKDQIKLAIQSTLIGIAQGLRNTG